MNGYFKLAIAAAILAAGFGGGWTVEAWRMSGKVQAAKNETTQLKADYSKRDAAASLDYTNKLKALTAERDALASTLAGLDAKHTKELSDAKQETVNLRNCVASGKCGLRVNATCPVPATVAGVSQALAGTGLDTGAGIRLTPDAEQAYYTLRDGLKQQQITLQACQERLAATTGQTYQK